MFTNRNTRNILFATTFLAVAAFIFAPATIAGGVSLVDSFLGLKIGKSATAGMDKGTTQSILPITTLGTAVTEDFDTLANTGGPIAWVDNSNIVNGYATQSTYIVGTGSGNGGGMYSFGVAGANPVTDRALGTLASGSVLAPFTALRLINNSGTNVGSVAVNYTGEQWRNGGNTTAQSLVFQYQVANAGVISGANTPSTGWTNVTALNFTSPIATATAVALDGNLAANRTLLGSNITFAVVVANGQEIWIRWGDVNDVGNDHGLAIDDVSVTAFGPTAADGSISGRVTTADGNGIVNATMVVSGNGLATPRTVRTSSFGYFQIDGLDTGETYVLTVVSKRFTFQSPSRVVSLNDTITDADFVADGQ